MKNIFKLTLLFTFLLICNNVLSESKTLYFSNFNGIDVSHGLSVIIKHDTLQRVQVESNNNDFNALIIEVKNRTLIIRKKMFSKSGNVKIIVYSSYLEKLIATAGSKIIYEYEMISDYLNCKAYSGAQLSFMGQSKFFEGEISSGANIKAKGKFIVGKIITSSGAHFEGKEFDCETAYIEASSGSNIIAKVSDYLGGSIKSGANVTIIGKPTNRATCNSGGNIIFQ